MAARLLLLGLLLLGSATSQAAGLALGPRGARPMGRAGAFVAGADDPGGIWYNPATIGGLPGIQVMADAALIFYAADYTRVDSGGNLLPRISSDGPLLPIPTLAASMPVLRDRLFAGLAVSVPYSPILNYPRPSYAPCDPVEPSGCLDTSHSEAPERYSLISQVGTRLVQLDLTMTVRIIDGLYLGASLQNLFVTFATLSTITSYNGALSSGPEDPDFDSLAQMEWVTNFNPSGKLGVIWVPHPKVRVGLAYQLPFWIRGGAKINVQLPVSPLYQKATVEGDEASVALNLPMSLRAGVEWTAMQGLKVELDLEWEQWSATPAIDIEPKNIYILNLPSIDRYKVPHLENPLHFQDSMAVRLGGEYTFARFPLVLRAGYLFERGAVQQAFASPLSLDNDKHVITLGVAYTLWGIRLDVGFARSFSATRVVDYRESLAKQVNPINPTGAVGVGGGTYHADYTLLGVGLYRVF